MTSTPNLSKSIRARSSSRSSRAQMATREPARANSRAITRPSPRDPPVINTVLLLRSYSNRWLRVDLSTNAPAASADTLTMSFPVIMAAGIDASSAPLWFSLRISAFLCGSAVNRLSAHIYCKRRRGTQRYAEKKFELRHPIQRDIAATDRSWPTLELDVLSHKRLSIILYVYRTANYGK